MDGNLSRILLNFPDFVCSGALRRPARQQAEWHDELGVVCTAAPDLSVDDDRGHRIAALPRQLTVVASTSTMIELSTSTR
jgi:hypothetical protein